ncbi:hypothetical protein MAPG_05194 [Magnaporthiopsis poae ATCC 64411]|uniref:Uncharacterized protein n=1 Tax=Magnaporthiopsis poae (strain ATCC 64411 / 73-15) TaxID=644358 RepID=A0A0C4DYR8_MAGP6|nr:hypothetical protein MAPG_05194 [Magnaporthiopsis poae ATCC 64411]
MAVVMDTLYYIFGPPRLGGGQPGSLLLACIVGFHAAHLPRLAVEATNSQIPAPGSTGQWQVMTPDWFQAGGEDEGQTGKKGQGACSHTRNGIPQRKRKGEEKKKKENERYFQRNTLPHHGITLTFDSFRASACAMANG